MNVRPLTRDVRLVTNRPGSTATLHRVHITELCARRGVMLRQLPSGAYRLYGDGIDVMVTDLAYVSESDLAGEVWTKRPTGRNVETTTARGRASFPVPSY